jgi:hypothetical protein
MALVGVEVGGGVSLYCTAALVAPSVVLTAAHCASMPPSSYVAVTGRLELNDASAGQVLGVSRVVISPTWNPNTYRGDIALLQLAQPSTAQPIPVASSSEASWAYQSGNAIILAGWGRTNEFEPAPTQLNWAKLSIQSEAYCSREFSAAYQAASMFCASQPGAAAGACWGDSGAPAVVRFPSGEYKVIGVASVAVVKSCTPPDAFARVTDSSAWLDSQIALLQATAAPAEEAAAFPAPAAPALVPLAATQAARKPPWLRTRPSAAAPGKLAKLPFWPGSNSGSLRVQVRVVDRGVVVYSKLTRYFQPTPRVWALLWRVPRKLTHSVRFCMSATLFASDQSSSPSCSTLRIARP